MANLSNINNKFIVADSSGQARVSIGSTTTGFPLTINGTSATDIFVVQDTSNNMAHIWTTGASGYAKFGLRDNGTMKTIISAGSDSYFQGGNVGIGTDAPGESLQVVNADHYQLRIGTVATYYEFGRNYNTGALWIQGSQVSYNNIVLAPTSGNVGIGATAPQELLDVNTNVTGLNVDNTVAIFGNDVGTTQSRYYCCIIQ